jgi:DNA-binding NarL/FixJ family response regulator
MSARIVLADDHTIMREGLKALLAEAPGLEVVGEADNGRAAAQLARRLSPDVVIMDVAMPDMNGIEATRRIRSEVPQVKVIGLSLHAERRPVTRMLGAGASGYLLKGGAFQELVSAIHAVMAGQTYLSPAIAAIVAEECVRKVSAGDSSTYSLLTPREREVLQLVAEGNSTKQIALELHVSVKTVETHRSRVMAKLRIHSIAELTKYAISEGLTSLES